MGERLNGIQEVGGSSPLRSTLMGRIGVVGACGKVISKSVEIYTYVGKTNHWQNKKPNNVDIPGLVATFAKEVIV